MSLVTLSMTASTYLFYQHNEYVTYDEIYKKRTPGLNDPKLINTLVCTLCYLMVNCPRICANALIISISPRLALVMMSIELLPNLWISNKYAIILKFNASFPSGIMTAFVNYVCPFAGPIQSIGKINL